MYEKYTRVILKKSTSAKIGLSQTNNKTIVIIKKKKYKRKWV